MASKKKKGKTLTLIIIYYPVNTFHLSTFSERCQSSPFPLYDATVLFIGRLFNMAKPDFSFLTKDTLSMQSLTEISLHDG